MASGVLKRRAFHLLGGPCEGASHSRGKRPGLLCYTGPKNGARPPRLLDERNSFFVPLGPFASKCPCLSLGQAQGTDFLLHGAVPTAVVGLQLNLAFEMESWMLCKRLGRVPS